MANGRSYALSQPTLLILDRVCNRWAAATLALLLERPIRFNQLARELGAISQKTLSQTLKGLERDGLVRRKVIPSVPVTVEYSVTDLGMKLLEAFDPLQGWAEANYALVVEAQERFDRRRVADADWPSATRMAG